MSRQNPNADLVIGGEPRVDLLPPEVRVARRGAATRRGLLVLLAVCLLIVVGGYVFASMEATAANNRLTAEQSTTTTLLGEQQKYITVRQVDVGISSAEAATRVGLSTEVDWAKLLGQMTAGLPGSVTGITIESVTPIQSFAQPTIALSTGRIATVNMIVAVSSIPAANEWITSLANIKGVSSTSVSSVQAQDAGVFTVNATIAINKDALMNPLTTKDSK